MEPGKGQHRQKEMERAETLALQAMAFLLTQEESLHGFMDQTGFYPQDFHNLSQELLTGILEFIVQDEKLLLQFCGEMTLDPQEPLRAYLTLNPGGIYG